MPQSTCSIADCEKRPPLYRRFCSMHAARIQRHGSPYILKRPLSTPLAERFHRGYVVAPDGCWIWKKPTANGYASISVNNYPHWAHRVGYELLVGAVPEGLELDHLCRVPACVNPAHLEPVTHQENCRRGARHHPAHRRI